MSTSISGRTSETKSNAKGIAWATVAVGLFALIYISGKLTGGSVSALQIIWLRYVGGFATVVSLIFFSGESWKSLATRQPHVHLLRAAAGGGGGVAAIYAAANMPVADATAIGLLDGLFTILLGVFILREVVSIRQWAAALLCLAGAAIVVFGNGATLQMDAALWLPATVALAGAVLVAVESILIKTLARSEASLNVLFYVNFFGMIVFALPGLWSWQSIPNSHLTAFLCLGPVAIIAQTCNIEAFRNSDAAMIGPVRYSWIVFGALFGLLFFGEQPNAATYVGSALILSSGIWLATSRTHALRTGD